MLKVRVIPTLLWKGFGLVKGVRFDSWRRVGPVLPAVRVYTDRDVDELVLLDIAAHAHPGTLDYEALEDVGRECFVPLTIGGGVRTVDQARRLLRGGADKVAINSAAYAQPGVVDEIVGSFGSQSLVISIDAVRCDHLRWEAVSHAGTVATGRHPVEWAKEVEGRGAGEILVTSVDQDGTMEGYDLDLVAAVTEAVSIPVIASGGAGSYDDLVDGVLEGGASAVAAASIFHFTEMTPAGAKDVLAKAGVPVRK